MSADMKYGGFEVINEIGRGGMGVVYRARQASLDRIVALKVLPPHNHDEKAAVRFGREAHAMAQLQHPNIVDVIEVGEEGDTPYFAMQYIEGEGLDEIIQRDGALSPERAADIAAHVADGLQHAHERGVIHRDIKPSNVLIAGDGRPVVTDFGIAKAVEGMQDGLSLTQGAIGTPEYMSPEVIKGNPIDGRADVYSLGIVLYHMVTGQAPFTATTPYQIADRHLREAPPYPRSMGVDCPQWLESIILKALAKDPSERFASAAEMASALRSGRPVAPPKTELVPPAISTAAPTAQPAAVAVDSAWSNYRNVVLAVGAAGILLLGAAVGLLTHPQFREKRPPEEHVMVNTTVEDEHPDGAGGDADVLLDPQQTNSAEASVPSVVGLTQQDAEQRLKDSGNFLIQYNAPRYSDSYDQGRIISQHPESGTTVEPGDLVTIVVSKGSQPGPTPVDHDAVRSVCYRWRDTWSAENIDGYFACYSKSAQIYSNDRWYGYWEYQEHERNKFRQGDIRITIGGSIDTAVVDNDTIKAVFSMTFERFGRNPYASSGRQTLTFDRTASGDWLIVRDRFERY